MIQKKMMMAAVIASSAFAFATFSSPAAEAGPIVPPGHVCMRYSEGGGTDCSFTTYNQCLASASGIHAECYAAPAGDDARGRRTYGTWNGFRSE